MKGFITLDPCLRFTLLQLSLQQQQQHQQQQQQQQQQFRPHQDGDTSRNVIVAFVAYHQGPLQKNSTYYRFCSKLVFSYYCQLIPLAIDKDISLLGNQLILNS